MKRPFIEIKKSDVQRMTDWNKERIQSTTLRALNYLTDPKKKERREQSYCVCCFYAGAQMAGQAMTESQCGLCAKEMRWSSTHQEKLCLECAAKWKLCRECGAIIEGIEIEAFENPHEPNKVIDRDAFDKVVAIALELERQRDLLLLGKPMSTKEKWNQDLLKIAKGGSVSESRLARNPDFDWELKWWAFGGKFPLKPIYRFRRGNEQNTNGYSLHWMALRVWTMDSPDIGAEVNLSDYCLQFRIRLPYLIVGLFFPLPEFVSRGHKLWRKP